MEESDKLNVPRCSHHTEITRETGRRDGVEENSDMNNCVTINTINETSPRTPTSFCLSSIVSNSNSQIVGSKSPTPPLSFSLVTNPTSLIILSPITSQPRFSNLPSPASIIMPLPNHPKSLLLQALAKVHENSISLSVLNQLRIATPLIGANDTNATMNETANKQNEGELSPPDSLTNAPPSYSFVLRQMAARRPRLMGTFIPSPSFVHHTPPPNYGAAFDIYVDNTIPPPPRVYNFGFTSMPVACPECGYTGMTITSSKITLCTHLCAIILCLFFCWLCAPLPYLLRSCKDVYHYCSNCRNFLGMYCPTNPENN